MLEKSKKLKNYPPIAASVLDKWTTVFKNQDIVNYVYAMADTIGMPQLVAKDKVAWFDINDTWTVGKVMMRAKWLKLEFRDQYLKHVDHFDMLYGTLLIAIDSEHLLDIVIEINKLPETKLTSLGDDLYELEIVCFAVAGLHKKFMNILDLIYTIDQEALVIHDYEQIKNR